MHSSTECALQSSLPCRTITIDYDALCSALYKPYKPCVAVTCMLVGPLLRVQPCSVVHATGVISAHHDSLPLQMQGTVIFTPDTWSSWRSSTRIGSTVQQTPLRDTCTATRRVRRPCSLAIAVALGTGRPVVARARERAAAVAVTVAGVILQTRDALTL
jgi:hypothetical protein